MVKHCENILRWQSYHGRWVGRERGYVGHVSVSRSVGRFFSLYLPLFFIPADFFIRLEGRRPSVMKQCVCCVGWGSGEVVAGRFGGQRSSLTGKPCSAIFNSWDTTWLMVFLDLQASCKPRTELVSNNQASTKCAEIIHAACITSRWS